MHRNYTRNVRYRSAMKTQIKKTLAAISEKTDDILNQLKATIKTVDSSARKGIIHTNKAARIKSKLTKKVNSILEK